MKTSKLFTIDTEIAERLSKIENSSALINSLLADYFAVRVQNHTIRDEKKAIIDDLKKKLGWSIKSLRLSRILINSGLIIIAWFGWKPVKQILLPSRSPSINEEETSHNQQKILKEDGS